MPHRQTSVTGIPRRQTVVDLAEECHHKDALQANKRHRNALQTNSCRPSRGVAFQEWYTRTHRLGMATAQEMMCHTYGRAVTLTPIFLLKAAGCTTLLKIPTPF
eukprot:1159857-Pelagomonas_calceolata.AAC.1